MKKIYAIDWKRIHPGHQPMSTDQYYTALANRVLNALDKSGAKVILENDAAMCDAAVRLTAWFEDICSGNMLWPVVNKVCQQRYGKPLPFYDTTEYYPGEPNIQDIKLLLWDIIQSYFQDSVVNPENAGIDLAASKILDIFDEEYETAPETEELMHYLADPAITSDYWKARKAIEWFSLGSYLSLRSSFDLMDSLDELEGEYAGIMEYSVRLRHYFITQSYVVQLTAAQWLSMATCRDMEVDTTLFYSAGYDIVERGDDVFVLRNISDGNEIRVETDSFDANWLRKTSPNVKRVFCDIVGYNGKFYQVGAMVSDPAPASEEAALKRIEDRKIMADNAIYSHELFQKLGEPIVFLKGIDEVMDFYTKRLGSKMTESMRKDTEKYLRENSEHGMVAIMSDPKQGYLTICHSIPAIKAPNNPWYSKEYAMEHALDLVVSPNAIDYYAAVYLVENGMLPDAALTSRNGYEDGNRLLQDNARYFVDYFFAKREEFGA